MPKTKKVTGSREHIFQPSELIQMIIERPEKNDRTFSGEVKHILNLFLHYECDK